jgi:hypothetical protein
MATHEREITAPVDLCTEDGRRLNPAARGWSRVPLHNANLRGRWGRNKRWDYWCVLAGDLVVSATYADVDYLGIADVWWADLPSGRSGGRSATLPGAFGLALPDRPGSAPLRYRSKALRLELVDDPEGTTLSASWRERDGRDAALEVRVDLPRGHESLNVVIPWSEERFQYTAKHQARPARGSLRLGDETRRFGRGGSGGDGGVEPAWGVLDVGRGRWPYRTHWNWAGGAGLARDGRTTLGLQLGAKWTVGTGFTENGILVDGRLTKIGEELHWDYRWDAPLEPWRVRHPSGSLDLTLTPRYDKHSRTDALVLATEVHQVFGSWSGFVSADDGTRHELADLPGFAEESRSRW